MRRTTRRFASTRSKTLGTSEKLAVGDSTSSVFGISYLVMVIFGHITLVHFIPALSGLSGGHFGGHLWDHRQMFFKSSKMSSLPQVIEKSPAYLSMFGVVSEIFSAHQISCADKNSWSSSVVAKWLCAATLTREVAGSNPVKSHWWMTGRASGPKMLTAPAKSQLTIGYRPSPVKTGSVT